MFDFIIFNIKESYISAVCAVEEKLEYIMQAEDTPELVLCAICKLWRFTLRHKEKLTHED